MRRRRGGADRGGWTNSENIEDRRLGAAGLGFSMCVQGLPERHRTKGTEALVDSRVGGVASRCSAQQRCCRGEVSARFEEPGAGQDPANLLAEWCAAKRGCRALDVAFAESRFESPERTTVYSWRKTFGHLDEFAARSAQYAIP